MDSREKCAAKCSSKSAVNINKDGLMCFICKKAYHFKCAAMSEDLGLKLVEIPGMFWSCSVCLPSMDKLININFKEFQQKVENSEQMIASALHESAPVTRINEIEQEIKKSLSGLFKDEISKNVSEVTEDGIGIAHDLTKDQKAQVKKLVDEAKEKEKVESGEYIYRVRDIPRKMRIVKLLAKRV
ncbi:hypothetical protein HELRODRAFT_160108 [Helobdella robusta]|uniref:PHD-type domain-containing protein n=1 Tax=Helobdella robusta TaxID=6412 RepID=T1EPT1_HELRO|nr:hypothetical protein HELRODRAFT_160108 [Helobdella robusta]ESO06002.1 hypothetical protein HELRODRAFT_160108 [Helobdella robusta]